MTRCDGLNVVCPPSSCVGRLVPSTVVIRGGGTYCEADTSRSRVGGCPQSFPSLERAVTKEQDGPLPSSPWLPVPPCDLSLLRTFLPLWCHLLWGPTRVHPMPVPCPWASKTSFLYKSCNSGVLLHQRKRTNMPYDSHPKELKVETQTDTGTPIFTAALLAIAKDKTTMNR